MSQEALVSNPELESPEALDAEQLWSITGVTGEGAHGRPDIVQADNTMWAALKGSGRAAVNGRYVDSEPQGDDRLRLRDIYSSVGLAFFPGTVPVSTAPVERGRYSSLMAQLKSIERGLSELDMLEEIVDAQSLAAAIEKKRHTDLTSYTGTLNQYLAAGVEVRIRMIGNGERTASSVEEYAGGKRNKPAKHDKLAKLETFVLTKTTEVTPVSDAMTPYALDLIMSDRHGNRGRIPEGYKLYGPYVKVTAVKNKASSS